MKTIDEVNKYIVSICLPFCTIAVIWAGVSLQEVKTKVAVMETITIPIVDISRDNRERIIRIEATLPQKKGLVNTKNSESLQNYITSPLDIADIDNKRVDKLADVDIINYY